MGTGRWWWVTPTQRWSPPLRNGSIRGSHFAQPTTEVAEVAAELSDRFGLPLWRFGSSGTEATMDAVHLMRAHTGRDLIVKAEGAYHGHHDTVRAGLGVP